MLVFITEVNSSQNCFPVRNRPFVSHFNSSTNSAGSSCFNSLALAANPDFSNRVLRFHYSAHIQRQYQKFDCCSFLASGIQRSSINFLAFAFCRLQRSFFYRQSFCQRRPFSAVSRTRSELTAPRIPVELIIINKRRPLPLIIISYNFELYCRNFQTNRVIAASRGAISKPHPVSLSLTISGHIGKTGSPWRNLASTSWSLMGTPSWTLAVFSKPEIISNQIGRSGQISIGLCLLIFVCMILFLHSPLETCLCPQHQVLVY